MPAPIWFPFVVASLCAIALWWVIFGQSRRVSLWSLLVLLTMLAVAFAVFRWEPRRPIDSAPADASTVIVIPAQRHPEVRLSMSLGDFNRVDGSPFHVFANMGDFYFVPSRF